MKFFAALFLSVLSTSAMAMSQGFALRTSENNDAFTKCAVEEALGSTNVFILSRLLYVKITEELKPVRMAHLFFVAKTRNGVDITFRMSFKSEDPEGWDLVQGENGEIYPFTYNVNARALLVTPGDGSILGSRDISHCLNQ